MDVVLVEPDIPWNTGNIGRTCVAANVRLHIVGPTGFSMDDRQMKRAGLDYWKDLDLHVYASLDKFLKSDLVQQPVFLFSRFAKKLYWDASFAKDSVLVFGSETAGLPDRVKELNKEEIYRIPTPGKVRSLNLSTSVGIVLFEALRQTTNDPLKAKSTLGTWVSVS